MASTIPAHKIQRAGKAQTAPFPTKQLFILGKSASPPIETIQRQRRFDNVTGYRSNLLLRCI